MIIEHLSDHPDVISELADWYLSEWGPYYGHAGPGDAHADLEARRLRVPAGGPAPDPMSGLVAARLIAEHDMLPDPALIEATQGFPSEIARGLKPRIRSELRRTLLGPHCLGGLRFLRDSGLEASLVGGVHVDAARQVAALAAIAEHH